MAAAPTLQRNTQVSQLPSRALFVHRSWFDGLTRPSAPAVLCGQASVAALWEFHQQLVALASSAEAHHAAVCLVDATDDATSDAGTAVRPHEPSALSLYAHCLTPTLSAT